MKKLNEAWFEFAGVRSDARGLRLLRMPRRYSPVKRGIHEEVSGRDGYLWLPEAAYMPVDISVECESMDGYNADAMWEWLLNTGEAWLRFSDEPDRAYKAQVIDAAHSENKFLRFDRKQLTIPFRCQPHRYEYPESAAVSPVDNLVYNPGTAESLPRIVVQASGDWSMTVGGQLIEVTGGGIIIDSELRDCLAVDGATLANSRVTLSEFPKLQPGANPINWTGAVSSVAVHRRVRFL